MTWELKPDRPIYQQLLEQIQLRIVSGVYTPGEKLPSVRELAAEAAVNPNTMQKAFAELERQGLVYTQRTAGRFITEDEQMLKEVKDALAREQIQEFFQRMRQLGYSKAETMSLLESTAKERG